MVGQDRDGPVSAGSCAGFRVKLDDDSLQAITRLALRELAQRVLHLDEQLALVTKRLNRITIDVAPKLTAIKGVGPEVASPAPCEAGSRSTTITAATPPSAASHPQAASPTC